MIYKAIFILSIQNIEKHILFGEFSYRLTANYKSWVTFSLFLFFLFCCCNRLLTGKFKPFPVRLFEQGTQPPPLPRPLIQISLATYTLNRIIIVYQIIWHPLVPGSSDDRSEDCPRSVFFGEPRVYFKRPVINDRRFLIMRIFVGWSHVVVEGVSVMIYPAESVCSSLRFNKMLINVELNSCFGHITQK